jgi:DNA-binding transcriptional LysR family regulator
MDSRFIESFVMVVDNGSIAEAARRLNLTPAGVAQRIRALETEIGTRLVFRSGRSVRPTEAGTAILGRARNFLGDVRDLKSIANNDRPSGELRLGATATSTSGLLPGILTLLTKKYPRIDVYMTGGTSAELYHKVLDGDLDAAVIAQPPFAIPKAHDWRVLREEPLVVLTPASEPVRDPHAILASEPLIRQRRDTWVGRLVDGYLRDAGIRPRERFELDTLEAIAVMVDRGLGVALVHDWAPPWPEGLSLTKLPVPDNPFGRRMGLIWTRASVRVRLVHAFLDVAAAALTVGRAKTPKLENANPPRRSRRSRSIPM